jgi:hypothetical protein
MKLCKLQVPRDRENGIDTIGGLCQRNDRDEGQMSRSVEMVKDCETFGCVWAHNVCTTVRTDGYIFVQYKELSKRLPVQEVVNNAMHLLQILNLEFNASPSLNSGIQESKHL